MGADLDGRSAALLTGGRGAGDLERERLNRLSKVTERVGEWMALWCWVAFGDEAGDAGETRPGLVATEDGVGEAEAEVEPLLWRRDRSGRWDGILEHCCSHPHKGRQKRTGDSLDQISSLSLLVAQSEGQAWTLGKSSPSPSTVASSQHHWRLTSRGSGGGWRSLGAASAAEPYGCWETWSLQERVSVAHFYEVKVGRPPLDSVSPCDRTGCRPALTGLSEQVMLRAAPRCRLVRAVPSLELDFGCF